MGIGTKEKILDAAERLFAERGFDATSLRSITAAAGVNLAAIHYHFKTKGALIREVLERRIAPINEERLRLLDEAEARTGKKGPSVEELIEFFVTPPIRAGRDEPEGGTRLMMLAGRMLGEPGLWIVPVIKDLFGEVIRRYRQALERALPGLDGGEILYRLAFTIGSMAKAISSAGQIALLSKSFGAGEEVETGLMIRRLVAFAAAGMKAGPVSKAGRKGRKTGRRG